MMRGMGQLPRRREPSRVTCSPVALAALLGALAVAVGCLQQDPASRIAAANDSNIRRLGNLYQAFRLRKDNQGPKDEAELKDFLHQEMPPTKLERMQIDPNNIEALFSSDRDGQPFVIRYGVNGGLGSTDAVVFEKQGRGGKKQVGFTNGTVETVDDARYDQLLQGG